ncbi:MAG: GspE/PulE family protein [Defluviitaleaceae bacterium]|nr:GspE/PulE family protein [Defluviitaleaceae bacterium]
MNEKLVLNEKTIADLTFEELSQVLAREGDIITRNLIEFPPEPESAELLDHELATRLLVLPLEQKNDRLWIAMQNPLDYQVISDLYEATGIFIEPVLAKESDIRFFLNQLYSSDHIKNIVSQFLVDKNLRKNQYQLNSELQAQLQSAPTVQLVDSLIESAVLYRASDIHIEPYENILRARFRIDGQLTNPQKVSIDLLPNIISRLKIMADLNIAEKRLPQDSNFSLTVHNESVDFRLSTMPTLYGEKAVIRLLYGQDERMSIHNLGFFPEDMQAIKRLFNNPYGAVIVTGPTGSGKTTTLTGFMSELNKDNVNIVTVEDPIENPVEGINHVAVDPKSGLDFPRALRHILRQDPDIIMVGEIRDPETALIAARAAITGHLVLSTLHTNDAAGAFPRLVDMGIQPFMVAASLNGIIAQRLIRQLCSGCAKSASLSSVESQMLKLPKDMTVYEAKGCNHCGQTGYKGRFALYEYVIIDETMRHDMAVEGYDPGKVDAIMRKNIRTMLENGIKNIILGRTTAAEVIRVVFRE